MKSRLLNLIYQGIERFWVRPIEAKLIPHLETGEQTRFRSALLKLLSWLANAGRVLILNLRLDVIRWTGQEWTITYIGDGTSIEYLSSILFPKKPVTEVLARTFLWQVPALIQQFTAGGDLVVCELNEILRWSPDSASTFFIVPPWVKQVLYNIDKPMDDILASMNSNMRRNIKKLEKQGLKFKFSQEEDDFNLFYYRMYLPYISQRHKGQGLELYDFETIHKGFMQGGLMLIMDDKDPVGGEVFRQVDNKAIITVNGIMDGKFDLVKRGVFVALNWSMINWAHDRGLKCVDFGGSRAQTIDGVFHYKRQWGTRLYLSKEEHTQWSFYAPQLPEALNRHFNSLGMIAYVDGKFYRVILDEVNGSLNSGDFTQEIKDAAKLGLAGLVVSSDQGKMQIISA